MSAFNPLNPGAAIGGFVDAARRQTAPAQSTVPGQSFGIDDAFRGLLKTASETAQVILPVWAASEFNRQAQDRYARPVFVTPQPSITTGATLGYQPADPPPQGGILATINQQPAIAAIIAAGVAVVAVLALD